MSQRFSVEQKAAARALLDHQPPTQALVAACMGATQRSMTDWIEKHRWSFVDFRLGGAAEAQAAHRLAMLKGYGRNVPDGVRAFDAEAMLLDNTPEFDDAPLPGLNVPAAPGRAGALARKLRADLTRLHHQLMRQFSSRGRGLRLLSVEAADAATVLAAELEEALRQMPAQPKAVDPKRAEEFFQDTVLTEAVRMLNDPESLRGIIAGLDEGATEEAELLERLAVLREREKKGR
jgi:hypothetical protein